MVEGVWGPGGGDETGWVNIEGVTEATTARGKAKAEEVGGSVLGERRISMGGGGFIFCAVV